MVQSGLYPDKIYAEQELKKWFGLSEGPYDYDRVKKIYSIEEPSGIIRAAFTRDFFDNYRIFFYINKE